MRNTIRWRLLTAAAMLGGLLTVAGVNADTRDLKCPKCAGLTSDVLVPGWATTAVKPKELSPEVKKGLEYLVNQQNANGGWGQGGGWRSSNQGGRVEGKEVQDPPDVGNTCIALLALVRAGNTPKDGPYAKNVAKALEFLCNSIDKSDKDSLYITDIRGTQIQSKIGPYADTFLASLVMAELKGRCDVALEKRLAVSLDKVVTKIEKNQKADGTFAGNQGWASVLSQGLANKGINMLRQSGQQIRDDVVENTAKQISAAGFDAKTGTFRAPTTTSGTAPTDAGVAIYKQSADLGGLQAYVNTSKEQEKKLLAALANPMTPMADRAKAEKELKTIGEVRKMQEDATKAVVARLDNKEFVQGFGSNGGEEFLSFLNISETLLVKGGADWEKWDKQITGNLNKIQDKDGGWSGHHCITGRTFCTASALLVLMADRTPLPANVVKEKEGK
jgi:hypothetical protein